MGEYLIVDGYNVINAWKEFAQLRQVNLEHARELLIAGVSEYAAFKGYRAIVVFDAQEVAGLAATEKIHGIEVVFTNEGETADSWIERRAYELGMKVQSSLIIVSTQKNTKCYNTLTVVCIMAINGAYRPFNDRYGDFYAAQIYMNGNALYLPTVYETRLPVAEAQDGVNCYLTNTNNSSATDYEIFANKGASTDLEAYAIHGTTSIANAASAGRAQNYLVTTVTDSTLTIGVRNENPNASSDWLGVANLHVIYYETLKDAEQYLDLTLECMQERATAIIGYTPSTGSDYAQHPGCPKTLIASLQTAVDNIATRQTPEEKYALIETFSRLFNEVLEARL